MRYSSICTTGANKTKDFGAQSTQSALTIFNPIELSEQLKERNDALVQYIIVLKRKRNEIYDAYYNRENTRNSLNVDIETIGFKIELVLYFRCSFNKSKTASTKYYHLLVNLLLTFPFKNICQLNNVKNY